jgi:hypothetical protein
MRRGHALLIVPLVAGAVLLVWGAPWSSPPDVIARARQAFGTQPVVHVLASLGVDPSGPAMRPITAGESLEVWYDARRRRSHVVMRRGTKIALDDIERDFEPAGVPPVAEAAPVWRFVTGYRSALATGEYRVESSVRIEGRRVLWLTARTPDDVVDVAVDPADYQPIWLRTDSSLLTQLAVAETKPYDSADFLPSSKRNPRHL